MRWLLDEKRAEDEALPAGQVMAILSGVLCWMTAGKQVGPYCMETPIGAGGMGHEPRSSERFERGAKTIANLNRAHICTLFDVGENYLVMETWKAGPCPIWPPGSFTARKPTPTRYGGQRLTGRQFHHQRTVDFPHAAFARWTEQFVWSQPLTGPKLDSMTRVA